MQLWHITFAGDERQVLFCEEASRRTAIRTLARVCGAVLVLFALVDEHLHLVVFGTREQVGRLKRAVLLALQPLTATPIDPGRLKAVRGRSHMLSLVSYLLEQPQHHGLPDHPATYGGSCFPDLVGARIVPGLTLRLGDALPRYRLRDAYPSVQLAPRPLSPASLPYVRDIGAARLAAAAASAFAVGPELVGRAEPVVRARRTAAVLGAEAGISAGDLALALGATRSALRKARERPCPGAHRRAVLLWLELEARACGVPLGPGTTPEMNDHPHGCSRQSGTTRRVRRHPPRDSR